MSLHIFHCKKCDHSQLRTGAVCRSRPRPQEAPHSRPDSLASKKGARRSACWCENSTVSPVHTTLVQRGRESAPRSNEARLEPIQNKDWLLAACVSYRQAPWRKTLSLRRSNDSTLRQWIWFHFGSMVLWEIVSNHWMWCCLSYTVDPHNWCLISYITMGLKFSKVAITPRMFWR